MTSHRVARVPSRGSTLVELLVALTLGSVVVGLLAQSVVAQRRAERHTTSAAAANGATDEAVQISAALFARISAADTIIIRGDTAIEWRASIGVAIACAWTADSVVLPDSGMAAWWEGVPDSGDVAELGSTDGGWRAVEVTAVKARPSGGACGAPHRTLWLSAPADTGPPPAVRITRRRRTMLYRGSDGAWWMGERRCSARPPYGCGAAQPIAGPLAPPPAGLRFEIDSTPGQLLISAAAAIGEAKQAATVAVPP
jgi:hypothetical protein